jgi:hypothetical protein
MKEEKSGLLVVYLSISLAVRIGFQPLSQVPFSENQFGVYAASWDLCLSLELEEVDWTTLSPG